MATYLRVDKQKRSKTRFLPFLPRMNVSVDVLGYRLTWKQAPILETLLGMRKLKKGIVDVAEMQFREMDSRPLNKKANHPEA